jgi:hypothetical protein
MDKFYGKYPGQVANNKDPEKRARVQVSVPALLEGDHLDWAMPCSPFAGPEVGFFAVPPVGANVWVEFAAGDLNHPIWSGCFWTEEEAQSVCALPGAIVLKTDLATFTIDDTLDGDVILIEHVSGAKIEINSDGIEIDSGIEGRITLRGVEVSINK